MKFLVGTKKEMTQVFDKDGDVCPVTLIEFGSARVVGIKTQEKDGYNAIVLGIGSKKHANKAETNKYKQIKKLPKKAFEFRIEKKEDLENFKIGEQGEIMLEEGDKLWVTGWSKGKGFAGVVKRWGFKGGPKTHGQSDRQRAPGSIGSGTTPGRVYKGKKMPGRMGGDRKTVMGLKLIKIDKENGMLYVKGAVPGAKDSYVLVIKK